MAGLARTKLTTPQKVDVSVAALAGQGNYGTVTRLSQQTQLSRPTIYAAAAEAQALLASHFDEAETGSGKVLVVVDEAQLHRAVVGLRCVGPNSIRTIEDLLPILYPGVTRSYGTIQGICTSAEAVATEFNATEELDRIRAGALDEMFSQGDPVLGGVDLDTGYLFALALRERRTAADWAEVLEACKGQGLSLDVVVKDAAQGIAAAVSDVFPEAEQRDDCFHAHYAMGKVLRILERKAYGAIAREVEAERAIAKARRTGTGDRKKLAAQLGHAKRRCQIAIDQFDRFESAVREAEEAMEYVDLNTGELSDADQMSEQIAAAGRKMMALDNSKCRKVGRYIINRADGLVLYMRELVDRLEALFSQHGEKEVRLACTIWRLFRDLKHHRWPWDRAHDERLLLQRVHRLRELAGDQADMVLTDVDALIQRRHRASSAIEGFNAALRPHLYVHKGVTTGFLELFRAYYNLRTRRWGRNKGTSAHQLVHGEAVGDWLTKLGYPPSSTASN